MKISFDIDYIKIARIIARKKTIGSNRALRRKAGLSRFARRPARGADSIIPFRLSLLTMTAMLLLTALICQSFSPLVIAASHEKSGSGRAGSRTRSGAQSAGTITVYGPRQFTRQTGPPTTVTEQFSLPANAAAPFTILVENGAPDGSNRVSSATITLNGATLYSQNDFNHNVASLTRTVTLTASNTLQVRIASSPGSFLKITFTAGVAALESVEPSSAFQGQTLNVTLHGHSTSWVAGQTRASLGGEVSVGGVAPGELGPVTVINATTAEALVTVQPTAALAPRAALVMTDPQAGNPGQTVALADAFKVEAATPPGASEAAVTTIAGIGGVAGFADGPAFQAQFRDLAGIAVGPDDSIYVADAGNNRIRKVRNQPDSSGSPSLIVSTLAGDGAADFADGSGASAHFNNPQGVAVDSGGIVYVADTGNNRIRRINADGSVVTIAGGSTPGFVDGAGAQARFNAPRGVAIDNLGNVYVADTGNSSVRLINAGGVVGTVAGDGTIGSNDSPNARFDGLTGVAVHEMSLYVYLADAGNHRIRRLAPQGTVITIAGAERGFADGSSGEARFADPAGIAIDGAGKIIVADAINSLVRLVDPDLAATNSPSAITTIAGTGERGLTDGAGNLARFFTPRGVAVSLSSAIIVADTANNVLRQILLPPAIRSISPDSGSLLQTVTIDGERFDARSTTANTVRFSRTGGGQSVAQVSSATRTRLTVTVPQDAVSGPVTVETRGGTSNSINFQVITAGPVINDFTPRSGQIGSVVTLTGSGLKAEIGPTTVTFAGSGGARLQALATLVTPAEVQVIVPNAAVTGLIELSNALGSTSTASPFTVEPGDEDYQLTIAPSSATTVQRSTATYVVYVTSSLSTFSQLVSLSATGLPPGVEATFTPDQITAGATSILSVSLANVDLAAGSYSFTIQGSGQINGSELVRSASATLTVLAGGQTTLSGRVLSTEQEPIMGATVSLDGKTVTTDAAGAFLLSGVTAGVDRALMVDGRTASAPARTYPVIIEPATIVAGQANVVPYTFYLPAIDTQYEVEVVPGQTTMVENPRVPGLEMMVPAGANLRNRDGSAVARVSITPIAIDRTPAPLPANVGTNMVFTSQPGGAVSDIAMPVVYPNLTGADPDTRIELYAFNHDTAQWYVYGYGRVSADGRRIEPEIDPATGRQYGLRDFSWHFPNAAPDGNPSDPDCNNQTNNTVDLSTGVKIERTTDIEFSGARGGLSLTRIYTSDLAGLCDFCPFGRGTTHNYAIRLTGTFQSGGAGRVVFPDQRTGRLFSYVGTDSDGALLFSSTATVSQLGDLVRKLSNGTFEYRYANGNLLRFDSNGRLTAMVDRNGNTTSLSYTGSNLTQITDAVGRSITLNYDSSGRIIRATDPLGRIWRYTYEGTPGVAGAPGLTTVTDPLNNVVRYAYVTGGRLASVTDKRGIVTKQLTYDVSGRVIEQRFAAGGFEEYTYGLSGVSVTSVTVTDSLGRSISKRFNASGYVTGLTDSLGQSSRIERDISTNEPMSTTGPCGCAEATRQFDSRGNAVATTDRTGQTTQFEYDPVFNNVSKITDKAGHVTRLAYDTRGNLISLTDALNQTTTLAYDSFGELLGSTDPLGHTTQIEYDAFGNVSAFIDALGNRTVIEHDLIGRPISATDPLGRRASKTYDALDRITSTTNPDGATSLYTFDPTGNLITSADALQNQTRAAYDARNRMVSITDAIGRVGRIEYDTENHITSLISASGRILRYTYNKRGDVITVTDPLGAITRFTYDNRRNLISVVDQRGNTTTYTYDELSRLISIRDPLGQISRVSYDNVDNITESVDRLGRRTDFNYDAVNRLTRAAYTDAVVTYNYDAASRLIRVDDTQSGSIQWGYDNADRLLSETTPTGIVTYAYNDAGQPVSMNVTGRPDVGYGYDVAGRVRSISQGAETFTYTYDALSRLSALERPNGVTTHYSYDGVNRPTRILHENAQSQPVEDYNYTYNADNEIISIDSLTSAQLLPSALNVGPADASNRITQFGSASFGYDAQGQTVSKTDTQGTTAYEWDARGRMKRATLPDGQSVNYGYDALGRLVSRTAGGVTTSFLYDRLDVVQDRGSDGSQVDYLNGPGIDDKLRQSNSGQGPLYFLQDHLGSTTALTDANGNVIERIQYDPFGNSNGSALSRYGFTGRERDADTGLMYHRARWYDPQNGRFQTQDPIGFAGGLNLYAYVLNNPLSFYDPTGLSLLTFFEGFARGLVVSGLSSFTIAFVLAGLGLSGGIPGAIILGISVGLAAALLLAAIDNLLHGNLCPDERDRLIGELLGGLIGGALGGAAGGAAGGRLNGGAGPGSGPAETGGPPGNGPNPGGPRTLEPGPNAGESIPARGPQRDFTSGERDAINRIGQETGCHTCGSTNPGTKSGNFIPDHQPPNGLNPNNGPQELYPHCLNCSRVQGGEVRQATRGRP